MKPSVPILELEDVSFAYDEGHDVVRGVSLALTRGCGYALVGANGAGKSTLVSIISGRLRAGTGRVSNYSGRPLTSAVAVVQQHLGVLEHLRVWENFAIGDRSDGRRLWIDRHRYREKAKSMLLFVGATFSPDALVGDLNYGERQLLAIARAVSQEAEVLILDEPTSALDQRARDRLLGLLAQLRFEGLAIVLVTHSEREANEFGGELLMLRNGTLAENSDDPKSTQQVPIRAGQHSPWGEIAFSRVVRGAPVRVQIGAGTIHTVIFSDAFERSNLFLNLAGAKEATPIEWSLRSEGKLLPVPLWRHADRLRLLGADRRRFGLFPPLSVKDTFAVVSGTVNGRRSAVLDAIRRLSIVVPSIYHTMAALSGGNQQKLLLAGVIASAPQCLIAEEPLLGLDRKTREQLNREIAELASRGTAVVVLSCFPEDHADLGGFSTRVGFDDKTHP